MPSKFLTIAFVLLALPGFADSEADDSSMPEVVEKFVFESSGEIDEAAIGEMLNKIHTRRGNNNAEVLVVIDGKTISSPSDHLESDMTRKEITGYHVIENSEQGPRVHRYRASSLKAMNSGTANCVLKNITKVSNAASAELVKEACAALNTPD